MVVVGFAVNAASGKTKQGEKRSMAGEPSRRSWVGLCHITMNIIISTAIIITSIIIIHIMITTKQHYDSIDKTITMLSNDDDYSNAVLFYCLARGRQHKRASEREKGNASWGRVWGGSNR